MPERMLFARLSRWTRWYNTARPHQGLDGLTPKEQSRRRGCDRTGAKVVELNRSGNWTLERCAFEKDLSA
ncbi:MAG: transposase [Planctomycetes bacterium]|nr:transposase [Planctomycetota bacterium]